jgi:hypothetical protein
VAFYIDPVFKEVFIMRFKNLAVTCATERDAAVLLLLATSCHILSRQIRGRISPECPRSVDMEWPATLDETTRLRDLSPPVTIQKIEPFQGEVNWPRAEDMREFALDRLRPQ